MPRIHSYLSPKCCVGSSHRGGQGIFAREDIETAELIAVWGGKIYTEAEVLSLRSEDPILESHAVGVHDGFVLGNLAPGDELDDTELMNHSCDPNAGVKGQIVLLARRVTDVCIPTTAFIELFDQLLPVIVSATERGERAFPYQHFYKVVETAQLAERYSEGAKNSWVVAAQDKGLPIFTPGFEDSTMGNMLVASRMAGKLKDFSAIRSGLELMEYLADWYLATSKQALLGFFQIGGGIAGDFPICVVPLLNEDLQRPCPTWAYFAQIGDSTTSYGSYSGAVPNEKITWGKIGPETPSYMIQSDATIVAPLIFAYVLGL